jgi:rhamnosyl/mannosyltransferase
MNRFLKEVDEIVATSPNYAETSSVLARYRSKVSIVPIGLPERTPPKKADLEKWQTQVGMEFFLFVGTLRYYKGLPFLTEAARQTGLPVVIVGNRDRGRVARGDIAPNVKFLGAIPDPDKEALLSLCRGFVFPSHLRSEAFGIALLEAARAGKPMISCEIGTGTSYVNAGGETGLIVPPADANALGHAMWRLSNNPEEAKQMGARARTRFERLFKSEDMCAAYLKLYKGLIAARRP